MEHREPSRFATADQPSETTGGDPIRARRFARFVAPPSVRRLSRTRIVLALLAALGLLYVVPKVGSYALQSLRNFVHQQPEYQLTFGEIQLEPPPPAWYRGGAKQFLERVRKEAGKPERFSVLDLDPEQLKDDFRRDGWVRKVAVEITNPNRVVVRLAYREPVAQVRVDGTQEVVLIDRDAVILPRDELDPSAPTPLLLDRGPGRSPPPLDPRAGVPWKVATGPNGLPEADERVLAGAKLADYLKSVQADRSGKSRSSPFQAVVAASDETRTRFWVQSGHHLLVLWGMPPGEERDDELPAAEKWKVLSGWIAQFDQTKLDDKVDSYFQIKGNQVELIKMVPRK